MTVTLTVVRTGDLGADEVAAIRALLDAAFDGDFSDADWEHCLGGVHVLASAGGLVGHAALVERQFVHRADAWRVGYVEGVAVDKTARRRRVGSSMMEVLERHLDASFDLGALSASEAAAAMYEGRGWQRWRGTTWALSPAGRVRTADEDGGVFVRPVATGPSLDVDGELCCDWREGDVW